jgi:AcrR family transcriptional regulator
MVGRPRVRTERLDERAIVAAALSLARKRLADMTMRSVSDELKVSVGALYKHVAGRDELVALVVEEVLGQAPPMAPDAGDGWLALRAQVLGIQALMDRYPGLDQVVMAHSPNSPKANELRRQGMAALQQEGLTLDEAHRVYRAVTWLWLGSRVALQGPTRKQADIDTFAEALDILISGLKRHITEAIAAKDSDQTMTPGR